MLASKSALFILGLVACAYASPFMKDGHEYKYDANLISGAGTMDVSPHLSAEKFKMDVRIQVSGNTLNVELSDAHKSMYVGYAQPMTPVFDKTTFKPLGMTKKFSVTRDADGKFESLTIPSDYPRLARNIIKGWASLLCLDSGEYKKGNMGYVSKEKTLHGICDVTYSIGGNTLHKTVSHMEDCLDRNYRFVNTYGGHECKPDFKHPQKKTTTDGLYSTASNTYIFGEMDGQTVMKTMLARGSLAAHFFDMEGVSFVSYSNMTANLVSHGSSSGDISVSGDTFTTLDYEFADTEYKWDKDRDLKAVEPFLASTSYWEESSSKLKGVLLKALTALSGHKHAYVEDDEEIKKKHRSGLDDLLKLIYGMNYDDLKSVAEKLFADKSEEGVMKSNIFNEILGSSGTTAAAMVVRDLIIEKKFNNQRDAARVITSVPYHIRRPNTQLVKEYEKLLDTANDHGVETMAIRLSLAHLIRVTCERADNRGDVEQIKCFRTFAAGYVDKLWDKYTTATTREDKSIILMAMSNIRYGGVAKKLKDLVQGRMTDETDEMQNHATWIAGWDAAITGGGARYYMPVFANTKLPSEVRTTALGMIFHFKPSATDLASILSVLRIERDFEVVNFAFTVFEAYSNTIDHCDSELRDRTRFFYKFLKQYSQFEATYAFGVSKFGVRQNRKVKYGYGGNVAYYVHGSQKSTTPLSFGVMMSNTISHSYTRPAFGIHLRVEGLAKGLVRKFKKMDASVWKIGTLQKILQSDMNIRERPDQPVRLSISVSVRGTVAIHRTYDENSFKEGGNLKEFVEKLSGMGETYNINHQRVLMAGAILYEQPSEAGMPLVYHSGIGFGFSLKAKVKRGNHVGLIFRNIEYDLSVAGQGHRVMLAMNPNSKMAYGVHSSRIYLAHVPRNVVIGFNPVRKEFKLSVSRPAYDDPAAITIHSFTQVFVRSPTLSGESTALKEHCPSCQSHVIVSNNNNNRPLKRVVVDVENTKMGYYSHVEYFDCDFDMYSTNFRAKKIMEFLPYHKYPKTLRSSIAGGIRQIAAFFTLFPRAEKCGLRARWSQSKENPTTGIEISVRAQSEKNGEKLFFRGRKTLIKAIIKAIGKPDTRAYKISLSVDSKPGRIDNKIKLQMNRAAVPSLGIKPYTVCAFYESNYPNFADEFFSVDMNQQMEVSGKAMLQYGEGTECDQGDGEIKVTFSHKTTAESREDLKNRWFYRKCMEQKQEDGWKIIDSKKLPKTEACYFTLKDMSLARHYTWKIKFVKLTKRLSNFIAKVRSVVQAGLLPYWDRDPEDANVDGGTGPFMNVDATFKNNDMMMDFKMETSQGVNEFKDYPLKLNWSKRFRDLKFSKLMQRLFKAKLMNPCVQNTHSIHTMDNTTYTYSGNKCWTLMSGHCSKTPSYAVFTKNVGGNLPLASMIYVGGHQIELTPNGNSLDVKVNGQPIALSDKVEKDHSNNGVSIFKMLKWGSSVNIYSFLKVWIVSDGTFVEVVPAPSVKGQHCGMCGNFNRNKYDEFTGKDGTTMITTSDQLVEEWKWKC